ncbi:MAG: VanW family protein [Lachnospiraceae bacterium]|nr:VanW family protein [Lachnospiraceae bacterium]
MRKQNDNRGRLILTGVLSLIAFALVLVLCFQHNVFGTGGEEPVSAQDSSDSDSTKAGQSVSSSTSDNDTVQPEPDKEFKFASGYTINGVDVSGKKLSEVQEALIEAEGEDPKAKVKVTFMVGEEKVEADTSSLLFDNNLTQIISDAQKASEAGDTGNTTYTSAWTVQPDSVDAFVHNNLDAFAKDPVEAYASGFDTENLVFIIEESENGTAVDFDKAEDLVAEALNKGKYQVEVQVETSVLEPKNTAEFMRGYLCKVSSTTSTTTSSSNRNTNIRLVCEKLNGLVLQPGEQFDFNKYIGQRTPEAGFKEAGGIYDGKLIQEYGGGICQANAMIYHSVTKADLQVDSRTAHTWPSDYVETGTDATVSWGGPEFRFTNSSDYPIALHAYYSNQKVTVEVYGRPLPDGMTIKLKGEIVSRTEAKVEYKADSDMALDERVTEKSAHDSIKAKSYKVYYDADGNEIKREEYFSSSYPMINKVVRVGTRAEDGTIFKLNKETGETIAPEGYVPPTPTPDPDDPENIDDDDEGDDDEDAKPTKKPKKEKKDKQEEQEEQDETPTSEPVENAGETGSGSENEGNTENDPLPVAEPVGPENED